jgi:transposase
MGWTVAIGVDTHRDWHVAVAVDRLGRLLGSLEIAVDGAGFARLLEFARSLGEPAFVVEGTGSYGASLTRWLLAAGLPVFECERPERRGRRAKNDLLDAEAAARRLLDGRPLPQPRRGAVEREQLRLLLAERRSAQQARVQALNQLKAAIVTLDPPQRAALAPLAAAALNRHPLVLENRALAPLRRLAERIAQLEQELAAIDHELSELTQTLCPRLLQEPGVGPVCAAQLLVSTADPARLAKGEASLAALAGVSPVEASSGPTRRHRLNRGGDRQLNWALHMTALSRIQWHPETRAYYQRLLDKGKSRKEAIRIVKRALARRLYQALTAPA